MKKLLVLLVLVAGCGYGASRGVDYYNYEINTPVSNHSEPVPFTVQLGEGADQVGSDLQDKHLIRSQDFFAIAVCAQLCPQLRRRGSTEVERKLVDLDGETSKGARFQRLRHPAPGGTTA